MSGENRIEEIVDTVAKRFKFDEGSAPDTFKKRTLIGEFAKAHWDFTRLCKRGGHGDKDVARRVLDEIQDDARRCGIPAEALDSVVNLLYPPKRAREER